METALYLDVNLIWSSIWSTAPLSNKIIITNQYDRRVYGGGGGD